jgi:ribosome biogenesis GTPase / thiamine phosphate phosphatase
MHRTKPLLFHTAVHRGLVVGSFGRHCLVETPDARRVICHPRGKNSQVVVGDQVHWQASQDEGTIESIVQRRNLLYRQDEVRTKSFAANLDQVLILIAAEPEFSEKLLSRALIAAEAESITPIIALNKSDLAEPFERAWTRLLPYQRMHYQVLPLCLRLSGPTGRDLLLQHLRNKTTLVLGPSGAGKSTLINLLVPGTLAQTNEVSQALRTGKHTTTSTTWYWVDAQRRTALIDSPGFQEFGLRHLEPMRLAHLMPDLKPHTERCKFYNCSHLHEPGCSVLAQVRVAPKAQEIDARRHKIYCDLFTELSRTRRY